MRATEVDLSLQGNGYAGALPSGPRAAVPGRRVRPSLRQPGLAHTRLYALA